MTQADVDSAWQNLIKAIQYLEFKQVDKTDLEKVIALAEEMNNNLDAYLDAGKEAFTTALAAAKDVYEDANVVDQEEVSAAWQNLLDAMANLMLKPDKGLLEDLIAQAESLNEADYEAQSFALMRTALAAAKEAAADENATQEDVDASAAALKDAIANLTASVSTDGQQTGESQPAGNSGSGTQTGSDIKIQGQTAGASGKTGSSSAGTASASKTSVSSGASAVKTGDSANVLPIAAAAAAALTAGAAVVLLRKKENN